MPTTRESDDPIYRAMVAAFIADKRDRVIPAYGIRRMRIPLDVALVDAEYKIRGDFLYADYNSTGVAECSLNNTSEDGFPLLALAGVQNIPYDGIYVTSAAQPGLFLNLWYGYNSQFISPTSAIATIGSITNAVKVSDSAGTAIRSRLPFAALVSTDPYLLSQDGGFNYGVSFASVATITAGTPLNAVAAASNTAGMIVWDGQCANYQVTGIAESSMLCKATAPTTLVDGDVLASIDFYGPAIATAVASKGKMNRSMRISSGKRLDFMVGTTDTQGMIKRALYTLF